MQTESVYALSFDLIQIVQIGLMLMTLLLMLLLQKQWPKNRYAFFLGGLLLFGVLNSYLLKFIDYSIPSFLPFFVFFTGPGLLFHIREYQMLGDVSLRQFRRHLILGAVLGWLYVFCQFSMIRLLIEWLVIAHLGIYIVWSINLLSTKKVIVLKENHEPIEAIRKRWRNDFYFLFTVILIYSMVILETFFLDIEMRYRYTYIVMLVCLLFLLTRMLVVRALGIYRFYKRKTEKKKIGKYKDSILSKDQSKALANQLHKIMQEQRPYLDEGIDLKSLASLLKIHPKTLSQVINENFDRNFFDYINSFRIEAAKKMLEDGFYQKYKIYEIMYEAGFNSRSSFNTAFKKATGLTAKAYRDQFK